MSWMVSLSLRDQNHHIVILINRKEGDQHGRKTDKY